MSYRVCLMGASFETGNMGVSALAAAFVKNILDVKPDAHISFLVANRVSKRFDFESDGRKVSIDLVNQRLSPKARIREHIIWIGFCAFVCRIVKFTGIRKRLVDAIPWLQALDRADVVCNIHGGDSFSDIYGMRRFIMQAIEDMIVLLMNKKLILLPQTYGPYKSIISRLISRFIIKKAYRLYSRDVAGVTVISGITDNTTVSMILFCPDIAFTLERTVLSQYEVKPPLQLPLPVPLVGINVNGLMYNGGYTANNMFGLKCDYREFLRNLVYRFVNDTDARIVIVPHTFGSDEHVDSDPASCRKLLESLTDVERERCHVITRSYDQSELKGIIGKCNFFVGSRMHACIAALSQGVPTVGMAYSNKFAGVFESVGVGDMIVDGRTLDTNIAVDITMACFNNRYEISGILAEKVDSAKKQISDVFYEIIHDSSVHFS